MEVLQEIKMDTYICDGLRTPFGRYGGSLKDIRADDLAAHVIKALVAKNPKISDDLSEVIMGCANQAGEDNRNVARMALLLAGLPDTLPGITLNRLCASGLEAIAYASRLIKCGDGQLVIAGGVEHMTRSPYVLGKSEQPYGRLQKLEDTTMGWRFINPKMKSMYGVDTMPETAEKVAKEFNISREDQDKFSLLSQEKALQAIKSGVFKDEIIPVELPLKKKEKEPKIFSVDEHPRETSLELLAKLKGVVTNDGVITAGNASGINDGAVATLIANEAMIKKYNLKPLARIKGAMASGVRPEVMGIGPIPAVKTLLNRYQLQTKDIGIWELNEAFASQCLAVMRSLELPDDASNVNIHGGAIAFGHPLGASGARITFHAAKVLAESNERYAVASMCVGVGQGSAILLEKV